MHSLFGQMDRRTDVIQMHLSSFSKRSKSEACRNGITPFAASHWHKWTLWVIVSVERCKCVHQSAFFSRWPRPQEFWVIWKVLPSLLGTFFGVVWRWGKGFYQVMSVETCRGFSKSQVKLKFLVKLEKRQMVIYWNHQTHTSDFRR